MASQYVVASDPAIQSMSMAEAEAFMSFLAASVQEEGEWVTPLDMEQVELEIVDSLPAASIAEPGPSSERATIENTTQSIDRVELEGEQL